jgi:hypothetical protein
VTKSDASLKTKPNQSRDRARRKGNGVLCQPEAWPETLPFLPELSGFLFSVYLQQKALRDVSAHHPRGKVEGDLG